MGQINLENYESVEQRLLRFKKDYPDYRMTSEILSMDGEISKTRWVVSVTLWKNHEDEVPAANGLAFEIDGAGMTQRAAALETCETSALGRALANLGYVGNRRVTREEMAKVKRHEDFVALAKAVENAASLDELRELWGKVSPLGDTHELYQEYMARVDELKQVSDG